MALELGGMLPPLLLLNLELKELVEFSELLLKLALQLDPLNQWAMVQLQMDPSERNLRQEGTPSVVAF